MIIKEIKLTKINKLRSADVSLPSESGVYLLFDSDLELLYIGQAQSIRQRVGQHIRNDNKRSYVLGDDKNLRFASKLPRNVVKYYSYVLIEDSAERTLKEQILIGTEILKR